MQISRQRRGGLRLTAAVAVKICVKICSVYSEQEPSDEEPQQAKLTGPEPGGADQSIASSIAAIMSPSVTIIDSFSSES